MSTEKIGKKDRRRTIGGRGREWANKCHKLLENMLELEDSAPFRDPVDSIRYPDYYRVVSDSMDLSKVMVKLHTGQYMIMQGFVDDVRLIFSNWEKYITDTKSPVYVSRMKLALWFESEILKIEGNVQNKQFSVPSPPTSQRHVLQTNAGSVIIDMPMSRPLTPTVTQSSVSSPSQVEQTTQSNSQNTKIIAPHIYRNKAKPAAPNEEYSALLNTLKKLQECSKKNPSMDTDVVVAIRSGLCTVIPQAPGACITVNPNSTATTTSVNTTTTTSTANGTNPEDDAPVVVLPDTPEMQSLNETGESPFKKRRVGPDSSQPTSVLTEPRPSANVDRLTIEESSPFPTVKLDVTHVWFAMCKNKPMKPGFLNESGFLLHLRKDNNDVRFVIRADEIVRCVAHLGNSKRQMMFVFVTPSCEKKLKTLTKATGILDDVQRSRSCSLIIMFLESLSPSSISRLIHVFWNISQKSIFGNIFTEVDKPGALLLLGNIKPQIVERVCQRAKANGQSSSTGNYEAGAVCNNGANVVETSSNDNSKEITPSSHSNRTPHHRKSSHPQRIERPLNNVHKNIDEIVSTLIPSPTDSQNDVEGPQINQLRGSPSSINHSVSHLLAKNSPRQLESYRLKTTAHPSISLLRPIDDTIGSDSDLEIVMPTEAEATDILKSVGKRSIIASGKLPNPPLDMHMKPFILESTASLDGDVVMLRENISLKCPITQQLMRCPMKNKHCGHSYDKEGAEGLISNRSGKARCPVPGCSNKVPLVMQDMNVDITLMEEINDRTKLNL